MSEFKGLLHCRNREFSFCNVFNYHVFGSFPASFDIYILIKYKVYSAGYIQIHKLCLCGITHVQCVYDALCLLILIISSLLEQLTVFQKTFLVTHNCICEMFRNTLYIT